LPAVNAGPPPRGAGERGLRARDHAAVHAVRRSLIGDVGVAVLATTSVLLFVFGLNLLYLTMRALRRPCLGFAAPPDGWDGAEARVCVQVPVYNERYVAERVIDAVCAIDWPRDRFEVQVLDDSIEQAVRSSSGYFTNFTGTAGAWRRAAIGDAGGWSARTLTEDLDLSYRAQLRGWRAAYVEDLVVPEELPVSIDAYRRQQSRWATGSFQTAFRMLLPVLGGNFRAGVKWQAVMHLLAYGVGPAMLVQLACYPLVLIAFGSAGLRLPWYLGSLSAVAILVGMTP